MPSSPLPLRNLGIVTFSTVRLSPPNVHDLLSSPPIRSDPIRGGGNRIIEAETIEVTDRGVEESSGEKLGGGSVQGCVSNRGVVFVALTAAKSRRRFGRSGPPVPKKRNDPPSSRILARSLAPSLAKFTRVSPRLTGTRRLIARFEIANKMGEKRSERASERVSERERERRYVVSVTERRYGYGLGGESWDCK